jgi:hypothetical protein
VDPPSLRSAGFQTCCAADFQVGLAVLEPAGLETRGTADLEVCATLNRYDADGGGQDDRAPKKSLMIREPLSRLTAEQLRPRHSILDKALKTNSEERLKILKIEYTMLNYHQNMV